MWIKPILLLVHIKINTVLLQHSYSGYLVQLVLLDSQVKHALPNFKTIPALKFKFVRYKNNSIITELIFENIGTKQFLHMLINSL